MGIRGYTSNTVYIHGVLFSIDSDGVLHVPAGQTLAIAAPGMRVTVDATDFTEDSEGVVKVGVLGEHYTFIDGYSTYSSETLPTQADREGFDNQGAVLLMAHVNGPDDEEDDEDEDEDDDWDDDEDDDDDWDDDDEEEEDEDGEKTDED